MNFYDVFMTPIEGLFLNRIRKQLIKKATGDVLEIGFGTGVNIKHLSVSNLTSFTGLDTQENTYFLDKYPKLNLVQGYAENLPFNDHSFDTVIVTLVLCSVSDVEQSLREIKRVLKPGGRYLFMEHILPKPSVVAHSFHTLNPLWHKHSGCNINRDTAKDIQKYFSIQNGIQESGGIFIYGVGIKK